MSKLKLTVNLTYKIPSFLIQFLTLGLLRSALASQQLHDYIRNTRKITKRTLGNCYSPHALNFEYNSNFSIDGNGSRIRRSVPTIQGAFVLTVNSSIKRGLTCSIPHFLRALIDCYYDYDHLAFFSSLRVPISFLSTKDQNNSHLTPGKERLKGKFPGESNS